MELVEFTQYATIYLELMRTALLIDPFYKISISTSPIEGFSECEKDSASPLSWIFKLNPDKHDGPEDVKYSIVECLLKVLFEPLQGEEKGGVISRLTTAISNMSIDAEDEDECSDTVEVNDE